ncbi:MAG: TetR/AcrR family transcriptional regulator [Clostridia bacterium]
MPRNHGEFDSVSDAILSTAARLFTQNGIHGTSLNDIAKEANLSKGTLYYYYPAKEQLVLDIASQNIANITDVVFAWVDSLMRDEALRPAVARLLNTLTEDTHRMRLHIVLCTESACGNSSLQSLLGDAYREWTVMLEVGTLKLQSQNSKLVHSRAQLFFACLDGFMLQNSAKLSDLDKLTIIERLF